MLDNPRPQMKTISVFIDYKYLHIFAQVDTRSFIAPNLLPGMKYSWTSSVSSLLNKQFRRRGLI